MANQRILGKSQIKREKQSMSTEQLQTLGDRDREPSPALSEGGPFRSVEGESPANESQPLFSGIYDEAKTQIVKEVGILHQSPITQVETYGNFSRGLQQRLKKFVVTSLESPRSPKGPCSFFWRSFWPLGTRK